MRRARRARHAWRDEPRAESGRSAQPACGERVRGSCRGTCAASSPRRAPRAGQRIKFILAPSAFYTAYAVEALRHPGTAVCRRHDAHVVRFRGALHHPRPVHRKHHRHRVGGFTEAGRCPTGRPSTVPADGR